MDFNTWLSSLKPDPPEHWKEWLLEVYFVLESIKETSGSEQQELEQNLQKLLHIQKNTLENEATKLGWIPNWGHQLEDILQARIEFEEQLQLCTSYQELQTLAQKEGFEIPELKPPFRNDLIESVKKTLSENIQIRKEQKKKEEEWRTLVQKCSSFPYFVFSFENHGPNAESITLLKEKIAEYEEIDTECTELERRGEKVSFSTARREILITKIVERKRAEYEIERREVLWKELNEIESFYKEIGEEKTYTTTERLLLLEAGMEKEREELKKARSSALDFDRIWRETLSEKKKELSPSQRDQLPSLPQIITPSNSISLVEAYRTAERSLWNRLWKLFFWLHPQYYQDKRDERERIRREEERKRKEALENWKKENVDYFTLIPAGSFKMGALPSDDDAYDSEKPRHKVKLTKSFWMSRYACTQELYEAVMGTNPSSFKGKKNPVENMSWCDAVLFCNKLSEMEGLEPVYDIPEGLEQACKNQNESTDNTVNDLSKRVKWNQNANGYRLPTEAEWEYCARGGEEYLYAGSDNIDEVAWYYGNSGSKTHPVGQKKANGFGFYDMSGNVFEWVWDSWSRYYNSSSITDPIHIDTSSPLRVYRGGSGYSSAGRTRVSDRNGRDACSRHGSRGFRFLRTV